MNKTLKTIGWILVALGILGILADAGAFVLGHRLAANRQALIQQWNGSDDGQRPVKPPQYGQGVFPRQGQGGIMPRFGMRSYRNGGGFMRFRPRGFFFLPVLFFALGPVLLVVGAVLLLVNRVPKEKKEKVEPKEEKETKKSKSKK